MVGQEKLPNGDRREENREIDQRAHGDGQHKRRAGEPSTGFLQDKSAERTHGGADQRPRHGTAHQATQPGGSGDRCLIPVTSPDRRGDQDEAQEFWEKEAYPLVDNHDVYVQKRLPMANDTLIDAHLADRSAATDERVRLAQRNRVKTKR
jgi:hypothetical protein